MTSCFSSKSCSTSCWRACSILPGFATTTAHSIPSLNIAFISHPVWNWCQVCGDSLVEPEPNGPFWANVSRDFNEKWASCTKQDPGCMMARETALSQNEIQEWRWGGHVSSMCVHVQKVKKVGESLCLSTQTALKFQQGSKSRMKTHEIPSFGCSTSEVRSCKEQCSSHFYSSAYFLCANACVNECFAAKS